MERSYPRERQRARGNERLRRKPEGGRGNGGERPRRREDMEAEAKGMEILALLLRAFSPPPLFSSSAIAINSYNSSIEGITVQL